MGSMNDTMVLTNWCNNKIYSVTKEEVIRTKQFWDVFLPINEQVVCVRDDLNEYHANFLLWSDSENKMELKRFIENSLRGKIDE